MTGGGGRGWGAGRGDETTIGLRSCCWGGGRQWGIVGGRLGRNLCSGAVPRLVRSAPAMALSSAFASAACSFIHVSEYGVGFSKRVFISLTTLTCNAPPLLRGGPAGVTSPRLFQFVAGPILVNGSGEQHWHAPTSERGG